MKFILVLTTLLLPLSCTAAPSQNIPSNVSQEIRQSLSNINIQSIKLTPVQGLYEVHSGDQVYYTDKTGTYLINGHMFNTKTKTDLTAIRLAEINRINWSDLPLENAVVSGPKDGIKMAVFTDPDCPYCKRLEKKLKGEKGIRVYTFLFPLTQLHPDAYEKSKSIWCTKDQHQAMQDVMLEDIKLPQATCKTPIDDNIKLAKKMNIMGTPTIFSEDGRKYSGGPLKDWLKKGS